MNLLALVLAGHFIGDWVVQTDQQAADKVKPGWTGWDADLRHVTTYTTTLALFSIWAMPSWRLVVLLGVSALTHAVIDRRWPVRWLMRNTGSVPFSETPWGVIAVDQALHLSILCVLVAILNR
jgi:hypothetical protein